MRASTGIAVLAFAMALSAALAYTIVRDLGSRQNGRAESCDDTLREVTVCFSEAASLEQSIDALCRNEWRETTRRLGGEPDGMRQLKKLLNDKLINENSNPRDPELCKFASSLISDCSSIREGLRRAFDMCVAAVMR